MFVSRGEPIAKRVERGAALLDRERPGWEEDVDLGRLQMTSTCDCILGQIFGTYTSGFKELVRNLPSQFLFSSRDHGFTADGAPTAPPALLGEWIDLGNAWAAEIERRRKAAAVLAE